MAGTELEVTFAAVLAAVEGDVERTPTSQEFSRVFDRLVDQLYGIDGLVDPGLWGQASNGSIEIRPTYSGAVETEAATDCATAVVREIGVAAGIEMGECRGSIAQPPDAAAVRSACERVPDLAGGSPRFVLTVARQTAAVLTV